VSGDSDMKRPDCDAIRECLSDYADGRTGAGAPDRAEIASHLEACEACREYLADIEAVSAGFRHKEDGDRVPAGRIVAAAMERIARGETVDETAADAPEESATGVSRTVVRALLGFGAALGAAAAVWVVVALTAPGTALPPAAAPDVAVAVPGPEMPVHRKGGEVTELPAPETTFADLEDARPQADFALEWERQKISDDRRAEALLGLTPQLISFDEEKTLRSARRSSLDEAVWALSE